MYLHRSDTLLGERILDGLKALQTCLDFVEAGAELLGDAAGDQGGVQGLDCAQHHGHTGEWLHHGLKIQLVSPKVN